VQWATKTAGFAAAERLYSILNAKHFVEGAKLNDGVMLAAAAGEAGLDADAASIYLESGQGEEEIAAAQQLLNQMGIHSIPTFIVNGRHAVGGAARTSELVKVFRQLEKADADTEELESESDAVGAPTALFAAALGLDPMLLEQTLPTEVVLEGGV
jgi:predicted DsbA family dithiol-disulfide isomerase